MLRQVEAGLAPALRVEVPLRLPSLAGQTQGLPLLKNGASSIIDF